ncbi:PEP/pyruvate-binding domain-containing protein [Actinokineospora sp. PR83]|uniref:PEP/pyruvate-binding domain-containing protein n=1 Tax=Actinokineospora sp. PR83 TaxID=2884908 RepID=UPI0027E0BCC1|nr:PEP/pyruvate-binding domain-containing protein [Actinokineospora sp. PR83]
MGEPLVVPLSEEVGSVEVGGKARALTALARAGVPVPAGFVVTTAAFRRRTDPAAVAEIRAAVAAAYAGLGSPAVAVRSSATAEDLPGLSFAGQHDTFLGVEGAGEVFAAVERCWASLGSARAAAYRERAGIDHAEMAVVVQELVDAESAGVLFTVDPVTGADGVVVNAGWGLGESVVDGSTTPDTYVVGGPRPRRVIGDKALRTVRVPGGTAVEPVPDRLRRAPVLTEAQTAELAALGAVVHERFGPSDVEWARHRGGFAILQARPVTGGAAEAREWNDTVRGDYLWTCANLGEAVPGVMTPATWSVVRTLAPPPVGGHPVNGIVGGRFYLNLSAALAVAGALGLGRVARKAMAQTLGPIPADVPPLPMARPALLRAALRTAAVAGVESVRYRRRLPALVAANPARCARLRERIAAAPTPAALVGLWHAEGHDLLLRTCRTFDAGARQGGPGAVHARLRARVGDDDAAVLATGLHTDSDELVSLGPALGLARLRAGRLDRATYLDAWGHRCADEFELSAPRPAEDPDWLDRALATAEGDPEERLRAQAEARARVWARHPGAERALRRPLAKAAAAARGRELARSEMVRVFSVLRAFWVRAGELTGRGDDVFFLPLPELLAVLDGDPTPFAAVPGRRVAYDRYRALPPYPTVLRGRFDPVSWAAQRDSAQRDPGPGGPDVTGLPGSGGIAEGPVRVLSTVEQGAALRPGEVLVTSVTNIGWTPLFSRAAAVVTDVGAPLSHAAIVARELGIPAVVGCGDATTRLATGTRVRVDGAAGTVTALGGSSSPDTRAAVVLAGGSGSRLGGVDKPGLVVAGRSLLDRAVTAVDGARTVVVGPERELPRPVEWTREDPPGGGPVAALRAALDVLADLPEHTVTVLLAADLPAVDHTIVARLVAEVGECGAVLVDGAGREQWLLSAWRLGVLRAAVPAGGAGMSLRRVLGGLTAARVPDPGGAAADIDTPEDLRRFGG